MDTTHAPAAAPTDDTGTGGSAAAGAVLAFYDALGGGNLPAALARLGDAVRWHEAPGMPYAAAEPYRGSQEVAEHVLARITADVDALTLTNEQVISLGTTVAALGTYTGTAHRSGRPLSLPYLHVWTVVDDTITEFRQYTDTAAFRELIS